MHSPTLANDFSFRLTLAFAPFQPLLSCCARCFPSKSRVLRPLRTLFLSCALFDVRLVCFQYLADSLCKTPGVWGTSATSPRPPRLCVIICRYLVAPLFSSTYKSLLVAHRFATFSVFKHLQIPFFTTSLYSHLYKTPGCRPPHNFSTDGLDLFSGNFPFPQSRVIVLASKGDLLNVSE